MLIRIVKLTFHEEYIDDFKELFHHNKAKIQVFEGCSFLELYQDQKDKAIFFTYSHWHDEICLNAYRNSELFNVIWSKTKVLFSAKPEAWSVDKITSMT